MTILLFISYITPKDNQYIDSGSDSISQISHNEYDNIINQYNLISNKVVPYIVNAKVSIDNKQLFGEVIEDKGNGLTYLIKVDDQLNWYDKENVTIINNDIIKTEYLLDYEIELYINFSSLNIESEYFIWVDLYRIQTYLLKKENGFYNLIRRFDCSSGADITPSKRGFYKIEDKGTHFYSRDNTYICYNYLKYSGSYLLHSFPYSLNKVVLDDRLNQRVSNGCIRFNFQDSKYLFDTIPLNSDIWVN